MTRKFAGASRTSVIQSQTPSTGAGEFRRAALAGRRLILASNRGPVDYARDDTGNLTAKRGAGGVVSALAALSAHTRVTWLGATMSDADRAAAATPDLPRPTFLSPTLEPRFVVVDPDTFHLHYNVFSNPILWNVQHYLWDAAYEPRIDDAVHRAWEQGYTVVNRAFADALSRLVNHDPAEPRPFVLLHDYQLYLVAAELRRHFGDAIVSHFVHIPWPSPGYWELLPRPMRQAILDSLCQADIVGFQTLRAARNFLNTCQDFLDGADVDYRGRRVFYRDRETLARVYPISVDAEQLRATSRQARFRAHAQRLRQRLVERTIVRVDRLDPSKNVVRGFEAYCTLLERRPDLRGQVKFLAFLVPTRSEIPEYRKYKRHTFSLVRSINERFGTADWRPIDVFFENNFVQALAGMSLADVILVNSVNDGMNLVAKEAAIVNERDAVLVLSESTGAHDQLGPAALSVSPGDISGTADALEIALAMPPEQRAARAAWLRNNVETEDLTWWVDTQLADLQTIATTRESAPTPWRAVA